MKQNKRNQKKEVLERYAMWKKNKNAWQRFCKSYFAKGGEKESIFCGMCE